MGHEPNGRRYDAHRDESPWADVTKRKNDVWEDATTRLTSTSSVASLDFGETFVDSSLPFGLLGLATPPRETPPARLKRPSSAPPSLSRSGVLGAKQKPASEPPPAPPKKSTPPALPKAAAPPSSKPASRPAFDSRPSVPSVQPIQSRPALETEREPGRRELTHTAPMASAPARTPSCVSIATPMAFAAPPSFIAPQSRMFDTTPTRPRFIEMREPLPSISVEVESLPPLFTPPKGSELAPIVSQSSPFFVAPPAPTFPSSAPPSPLAAFAAANAAADGSGSIPASVMALGDSGPASLSTREVSLAFRSIKPQTAYIWAAAILILGIASGTAFGSHLAPSATASEGKTTAHLSTPAFVAPTPAPPKVEAAPAQPPIEEITQPASKPAPDAKKVKQAAPQLATTPFVATVKPAAPILMQPPTQVGPSRIAVLGSPPSADTKKTKKGDKTEIDSAAAAATLADSQRETANAL